MLSLIPGWATFKLILLAVGVLGLVSGSAYITHKVDNSAYEALELKYASAVTKAQQDELERQSKITIAKDQASAEATKAQQVIVNSTRKQLNDLKKYANSHCITNGLIKLLSNSATSNIPKGMSATSRQPDSACSTITSTRIYEWLITNNGIANQNAKQLDELIDSVKTLNKF